jgi:hypothetical protein
MCKFSQKYRISRLTIGIGQLNAKNGKTADEVNKEEAMMIFKYSTLLPY